MSLFENEQYRWRETYFVLFDAQNRPTTKQVTDALQQVNERYQIGDARQDDAGLLEALTILSPDDNAAMDISFVSGEEVQEHTQELVEEMSGLVGKKELPRLKKLPEFDARLDVFHFEQLSFEGVGDDEEMDEFMDPGSLLIVLEKLARLTGGVGVDQESGSLI
jgi:hypothetical protein